VEAVIFIEIEGSIIESFEQAVEHMGADVVSLGPIFEFDPKPIPAFMPSPEVDAMVRALTRPNGPSLIDVDDTAVKKGLAPKGCRWSSAVVAQCWSHGLHPCEGCEFSCHATPREVAKQKTLHGDNHGFDPDRT